MRTGHLHEYEVPGEWPALSGGGETEGPGCQQGIINGSLTPGGPWLGSHSPYPVLTVAAHHPPPRSPISIPTPTGSPGPSCLPPPPQRACRWGLHWACFSFGPSSSSCLGLPLGEAVPGSKLWAMAQPRTEGFHPRGGNGGQGSRGERSPQRFFCKCGSSPGSSKYCP